MALRHKRLDSATRQALQVPEKAVSTAMNEQTELTRKLVEHISHLSERLSQLERHGCATATATVHHPPSAAEGESPCQPRRRKTPAKMLLEVLVAWYASESPLWLQQNSSRRRLHDFRHIVGVLAAVLTQWIHARSHKRVLSR